MARSEFLQQEVSRKRNELAILEAKLTEALGEETGIRVGGIVKKYEREYRVTRIDGESAECLSIYGVPKKLNGEFARRDVYLGWPRQLEVVK